MELLLEEDTQARPVPRSRVVFKDLPNSIEIFCVLNRQRGLTLARPTAAPTATRFVAPVFITTLLQAQLPWSSAFSVFLISLRMAIT